MIGSCLFPSIPSIPFVCPVKPPPRGLLNSIRAACLVRLAALNLHDSCLLYTSAKGYDLQIQEYTDYVIPNQALDGGDLDANYFQHKPYLDSFNEQNGTKLVSAGVIHYEPFGIYAGKTTDLSALPDVYKRQTPECCCATRLPARWTPTPPSLFYSFPTSAIWLWSMIATLSQMGKVSDIFSGPKSEIGRQLILGEAGHPAVNFEMCI